MRRRILPIALGVLLAGAACGPAEVVVTVEVETGNPAGEGTVVLPLANLEVQLLPYDRDLVFDSLQAAHPTPEPPVPRELLAARESVAAAQARWQAGERRWNNLRDTLKHITETMQGYSRGEARYVALFEEFTGLESQLDRVEAGTQRNIKCSSRLKMEVTSHQQAFHCPRTHRGGIPRLQAVDPGYGAAAAIARQLRFKPVQQVKYRTGRLPGIAPVFV
jgi:hypothetical protein